MLYYSIRCSNLPAEYGKLIHVKFIIKAALVKYFTLLSALSGLRQEDLKQLHCVHQLANLVCLLFGAGQVAFGGFTQACVLQTAA